MCLGTERGATGSRTGGCDPADDRSAVISGRTRLRRCVRASRDELTRRSARGDVVNPTDDWLSDVDAKRCEDRQPGLAERLEVKGAAAVVRGFCSQRQLVVHDRVPRRLRFGHASECVPGEHVSFVVFGRRLTTEWPQDRATGDEARSADGRIVPEPLEAMSAARRSGGRCVLGAASSGRRSERRARACRARRRWQRQARLPLERSGLSVVPTLCLLTPRGLAPGPAR